jgi:photosystem II stability/assembly factor-like uncharacterized protein
MLKNLIIKSVLGLIGILIYTISYSQDQEKYIWKEVTVGGGGFVPGVQFNESEKNLLYARTDIGGSYRWDEEKKRWIPITDSFDNPNDMGNVSIATDPSDPSRVYVATGLYYQSWWGEMGSVYASNDKGKTWTSVKLPFKIGGNTPGRGAGERLRIDPNKNNILYLGSQKDGLWKSEDYAKTWKRVAGLPNKNISFVEYLKSSGKSGEATPVIYIGVYDHVAQGKLEPAVYRSPDAGKTWEAIPGQPLKLDPKPLDSTQTKATFPMSCVANRVAISGDYMYLAYSNTVAADGDYELAFPGNHVINGAVYKYNIKTGEWKNITPSPKSMGGYAGVSISPQNPGMIAVISTCRWWPGDEVYVSGDGGDHWKSVLYKADYDTTYKAMFDHSKAFYAGHGHRPHWTSDIKIDPFNSNRAIFVTGYGVYICYDFMKALEDQPTTWVFENSGLEETAALEIKSPPVGPVLVTALGDIDGFAHYDLDVSPPQGEHSPHRGTCRSIDFAAEKPEIMVKACDKGEKSQASYSLDGGKYWYEFPTKPAPKHNLCGNIAISADGKIVLWAPEKLSVFVSLDFGKSWMKCTGGIPPDVKPVADKVNPYRFYAKENSSGTIFVSKDSGQAFTFYSSSVGKGEGNMEAVFGEKGHLWAACGAGGLWFSKNEGVKFKQILNVTSCKNVTFGKAAPGTKYPAIFIFGEVKGVTGLFRSDDIGKTWIRINDESTKFGYNFITMTGDPRNYGRLYIGVGGRGVLYGEISKK